jgi:hypothetical protein
MSVVYDKSLPRLMRKKRFHPDCLNHIVRKAVTMGEISIDHIKMDENIVDFMTKGDYRLVVKGMAN